MGHINQVLPRIQQRMKVILSIYDKQGFDKKFQVILVIYAYYTLIMAKWSYIPCNYSYICILDINNNG